MSSSSSNPSGPRVKHCQRISLPNAVTQAPPPPRSDVPLSINDIPTSTVTLKSSPLPPPPRGAPPKKKQTPANHSPFFDGVYGRPLFSLAPVHHFTSIPQGKSIIFNYFKKPFHMKYRKAVATSLSTSMKISGVRWKCSLSGEKQSTRAL